MSESKQVTIIIPCLKINALLYQCIEACLSQDSLAEIVIVTEDKGPLKQEYKDVRYLNVQPMNMSKKTQLFLPMRGGGFNSIHPGVGPICMRQRIKLVRFI